MMFSVCLFGTKCSFYLYCQGEAHILEVCKRDPLNNKNEFQFALYYLDFLFVVGYDPSMPRVMMLRADGQLATSERTYVDDIHVAGSTKESNFVVYCSRLITKERDAIGT